MKRLALLFLLAACTTEPCVEERDTVDILYAESQTLQTLKSQLVQRYQGEGWTCSQETLFDGFGRAFGQRYVCTRCLER